MKERQIKPLENNNLLLFLPKLCEFTKRKLTGCSVQTENARGENLDHDGPWVFACRHALTSETNSPRFVIAFRDAAVPHTASHMTPLGHWSSHGMVQRLFWFGGCGFFFLFCPPARK